MVADKMMELEYVESLSYETVRRVKKKRNKALTGKREDNPTKAKR